MKTKIEQILDANASPAPSKWRERAEYRQRNRKWLKRSQNIALTILERLDELQIKQKELAEKMGVSAQYVNKVLQGRENLSLETIDKFENVLGIELISVQAYCQKMTIPRYRSPISLSPIGPTNNMVVLSNKFCNYSKKDRINSKTA